MADPGSLLVFPGRRPRRNGDRPASSVAPAPPSADENAAVAVLEREGPADDTRAVVLLDDEGSSTRLETVPDFADEGPPADAEPIPGPGDEPILDPRPSETVDRTRYPTWDRWQSPSFARVLWADRAAVELRQLSEGLTVALAIAARTFHEGRLWTVFGCSRSEDYCRERLGQSARWLRNMAALGRACDTLPHFERALAGDAAHPPLGRARAQRVARIATPRSATAWIHLARRLDVRTLDDAVRAARAARSEWPLPSGADGGPSGGAAAASSCAVPDDGSRSEVRMHVPGPMLVAFDDVHDLHCAASGRGVSVADFVESLVAESMSGAVPPELDDVDRLPLVRGRRVDAIERDLARSNAGWSWLDRLEPCPPPGPRDRDFERLRQATNELLRELRGLSAPVVAGDVVVLDRRMRDLLAIEDRIKRGIGELLAYMKNQRGWRRLRFEGGGHYAAERLGLGRRTAQNLIRVAAALPYRPKLRAAYEEGRIGLEAAVQILRALDTRVTDPVTPWIEREWVARGEEASVKRLRDEVRVVRREWALHDSYEPRPPLGDDEWLRSLTLHPGTTRRRFERLVGVATSARFRDTTTYLTLRLPDRVADDLLAATEDRRARLEAAAQMCSATTVDTTAPCTAQTCSAAKAGGADGFDECNVGTPNALKTARGFVAQGLPVPSWVGLMALLEEYLATWDAADFMPYRRQNRTYATYGFRCAAPRCTTRKVEEHHQPFRSQGGRDRPEDLVALCPPCHRHGTHGETLACSGTAPDGLLWRAGRADVVELWTNERRVQPPAVVG